VKNDHPTSAARPPKLAARTAALAAILFLERLTAALLLAVVLALGWMVLVTYYPEGPRLASVEVEVVVMLALLAAALILVSVVALLHTRT
jgi:hypothetical protein